MAQPNQAQEARRDGLRVLILMAGPKFDLDWEFGRRLSGLSEFCEGALVVSSSAEREFTVGRFTVTATLFRRGGLLRVLSARLAYVRQCFRSMRVAKRAGQPIDLILTYDPLTTGAIGWLLASVYGARLICEVNGDYTADANFMQTTSQRVRTVKKALAGKLGRFVLRRAAGIRILFPTQLENLSFTPNPRQVVEQIPEFVNTEAFRDLGEQPKILLVGFPFYVKGVDTAIAAFKRVAARYPEWRLEIIGHYPDAGLIDAAIGGCKQISYRRPVPNREMNGHIGSCAIVLQSSRTEAMGRVLVEAMAASKPRIASNVGGIPTVVADGVDGVLVEPEDVAGFARALERLMGSADLRRSMGHAGAQRVATELTPERYFRAVERLFHRVAQC